MEWQAIITKLWDEYGIQSTGSKALDKQILHELELREAKLNPFSVSISKFLTITKEELDKLKNQRKEKKIKNDGNKMHPETTRGAEILGQQIFIAIQMKKDHDEAEAKRKRDNKYLS